MSQVGGVQTPLQLAPGTQQPSEASKKAASARVNGESVVFQSNTASQVADMAEEMSMVTHQFKNKTFDKRKAKSGSELSERILERIKKVQTIQNSQAVKDLLNQFRGNSNLSENEIKKKLKDFSDDVLEQFVALDLAVSHFEELGDTKKAEQLAGIRDELRKENETLIQAGLNVSEVAADLVEETGLGSVRELREGYADHVRDDKSLEAAYDYLVDSQGSENFEAAIKIQLKLLATDLGCLDPSSPPERLRAIVQDLSALKILVGMHDGCIETEEQLTRMFPEANVEERALMKQLLNLVEQQWVTEADFERLPEQINVKELEAQIFTLTKVVSIVRMIPEEVFTNEETRQNMLAAVTEGLDGFIEREADAEMVNASTAADQGFGIIGEITASLDLPELAAGGNGDLMPGILQDNTAVPSMSSPSAKPGSAEYVALKFTGQLDGEQYADPMDAFKDVQGLSGKPNELKTLLGYMPELRAMGPVAGQFADMAEKYIRDLLVSTRPAGESQKNFRQGIKAQNN